MQRWIANLLVCWTLLLLPGASALAVAQPQSLLPACCRTHGAHHCTMQAVTPAAGPSWLGPACPYQHLPHAALLLSGCLLHARESAFTWRAVSGAIAPAQTPLSLRAAGLRGSRAPPARA